MLIVIPRAITKKITSKNKKKKNKGIKMVCQKNFYSTQKAVIQEKRNRKDMTFRKHSKWQTNAPL